MNYQTGITKTKHVVLPERKLGGKNKVKHFKKEPPPKKKKKPEITRLKPFHRHTLPTFHELGNSIVV